jgi:hypothetical protein
VEHTHLSERCVLQISIPLGSCAFISDRNRFHSSYPRINHLVLKWCDIFSKDRTRPP